MYGFSWQGEVLQVPREVYTYEGMSLQLLIALVY